MDGEPRFHPPPTHMDTHTPVTYVRNLGIFLSTNNVQWKGSRIQRIGNHTVVLLLNCAFMFSSSQEEHSLSTRASRVVVEAKYSAN